MSLILAVTNGETIVVGADSLVYEGSGEVYRTYESPKLRLVGNGRWIIAFTGLGKVAHTVWDYSEAKGQEFDPDIRIGVLQCIQSMGNICKEYCLEPNANALLAGFSGERPHIYTWNLAKPSPAGGDLPPWAAIGCGSDLALHFARNCQPLEELNTEQLSLLVYFSISEIANSDVRVGKPIDLGTIKPERAEIRQRDSLGHFEERSKRLTRLIRENL